MEEEKKEEVKTSGKVEKKESKPVEKKEEVKQTVSKAKNEKGVKKENKKSNIGIIITIIAIVLVAIVIYMFLKVDSPKQLVETMLNDVKAGNYGQGILASALQEENFDQEAQKALFDRLEWKVLNTTEEGEKATVEVEITNKDFKTIIGNYMQRIIKVAFSGENLSEEEMTNYLIEELNKEGIESVTSKQSIVLEKKDGKWEIAEENNLMDILLPGFNESINAFNK